MHHKNINVPVAGMKEGPWQPARDFESEALPQPHGAFVGTDDKVELHSPETAGFSVLERVRAHGPGHSASESTARRDVPAIGNVSATALLIRAHAIGADDLPAVFRDEYLVIWGEPVGQRFVLGHLAR